MRRPDLHLIVVAAGLLAGCSAGGSPLRYVALDRPTAIPASASAGRLVKVSRTRFNFYRPPQDVRGMLGDLQQQCGSGVLRSVDVHLHTPFCLTPLPCIGRDQATAECME